MKKRKLNYRFHNPNPVDVTADYILKVLIEANEAKVERTIEKAAEQMKEDTDCTEYQKNPSFYFS